MAFWTGLLAGATGHQPGAFKGLSLKDILDEDKRKLWQKHERIGGREGRQFEETGIPEHTYWYKGMGKPELMGPKWGAAGVDDQREEIASRNRPDVPMGIGRDRPFPLPIREAGVTTASPPNRPPPPQPLSGNPYKRPFSLGMSEIGGNKVPTMYNPYMFGLRQDQMGAEQFNPLNRRIQQSKRDQRGLTTAGQYSTGIRDAVGTLGDAFLPADKVTKRVVSADPTKFDTETTTITEKILGPSGHRMGAFKDTAADVWKNIREDDIIKYWMNQFRGN
jgi:hypothetical protein